MICIVNAVERSGIVVNKVVEIYKPTKALKV